MANIDGGALSFKSVIENDQMNSAIEETLRRVQGLSDATVAGGKQMDKAFLQTADGIRQALGQIGAACEIHETELAKLEDQYEQLGREASAAFMAGRDAEAKAIKETQASIKGEITVRKQALEEARNLSNELEVEAQKREEATRQVEENAKAHQSLRSRIKELKEEMAMLIDQGIDEQSEAYKALVNELGRLQDIQGDIAQQGKILANDEAGFQGVIQGLSGLAGGFSAATGAISLFAGENENLQKVMTKVQSVMAIAMGMQQVAQTLNKDSAFMLVTVRKAKELLTVAELKFATALGISNVAAKALMATLTLGLSVAITATIMLIDKIISKNSEAKKAQEEFSKAMIEGAYKPIGKIEELSAKYAALGDNIKEKEKFIKDNKKAFDELGVSVTNVRDAENLLINNKEAFISAQIAKAKATIYAEKAMQKQYEMIENREKFGRLSVDEKSGAVKLGWKGFYNPAKELNEEYKQLNKEQRELLEKARQSEDEMWVELEKAGIKGAKEYAKGTVGAIEQAISEKQEALKDLVPNSAEWNKKNKEIEALQKQLEKPTKKTTSKSGKDPFVEQLEKRKAEYARYKKWMNSTNEDIQKAASTEFAQLLKGGNSYKSFLENLQAKIASKPQTNQTAKQLSAIRDELAELGRTTILDAFNESLKKELDSTDNILERLDIIAKKRDELKDSGDADTEVGKEKTQTLDDAEKNALQKQEEETKKLLDDYASYLDKKIKLNLEYSNDLALLEKARAKATTDEERRKIDAAMANRKKQYDKDSKLSGDSEYDQMLQTYRTFEQKMLDVTEEFEEKRKKAREHGNTEMLAQLDKAENEAKSKLALDEMMKSPDWEKMFGNLDEIGTRELERLLATIEGKTAVLGIELSPEDFKVIQDKVKELKNEIKERNPFKALTEGFKDLKKATNDQDKVAALAGMFDSAGKAGNQLKGIISDVTNTLEALGVEGTEEIEHAIQALDGLASGAQDAVMGFMLGNPVQMVGGAIKAIGSVVNFFAGANDRRAERSIKKHQENVDRLTSAYKELEWQISKALGGDVYKHQQASIENMRQQQKELQSMIEAERSKKKGDPEKIKQAEEQIKELGRNIEDTIDGMRNNLLATDAKAIASQLGDAIVGAFENGKDAATAWGDTVKNIVNNLVKNMLIQKILQEPIDKIISKYTSKWVDKKFNFKGFDTVIDDIDNLSGELGDLYPQLEKAINALKEKLNLSTLDNEASLTGAVKGVTEETASIVAGYLNAMRINQVEASEILRQQLAMLSVIAQNTSYNRYLQSIDQRLSTLQAPKDPLRSQGLQ